MCKSANPQIRKSAPKHYGNQANPQFTNQQLNTMVINQISKLAHQHLSTMVIKQIRKLAIQQLNTTKIQLKH